MPHLDGSPLPPGYKRAPLSEEARLARAAKMKAKRLNLDQELTANARPSVPPPVAKETAKKEKVTKKRALEAVTTTPPSVKTETKEKPAAKKAKKDKAVVIAPVVTDYHTTATEEFLAVLTTLLENLAKDGQKILQISVSDPDAAEGEWIPTPA